MFAGHDILEIETPAGVDSYFGKKPPKLWCVGDPDIVKGRLIGVISARKIDADLALKTSQLLRQLAHLNDVSFVGGWHSPLEEEVLRILSAEAARVIFCLPKSLHRFIPSPEVKNQISEGRVLLLTHCSPRVKRISRDASLRRNLLVMGMSKGLLVLSAPEGSVSLKLALKAISLGKPVFTPPHRMNDGLLSRGALPATIEHIQRVLQ